MPSDLRLLFILPDLAYITKLIPGKKEHSHSLSDFRQINGNFLDDNLLIEKNLEKLFTKIEAGSYKLVLPDFLFTNTIISLEVKTEDEVKNYFNKTLLASLGINKKDFYIDTTILSNYKGMFKVQLTALEKSVITPLISILSAKKDIKIESISPLSWTSKSIISLEPSVSIMQLGGNLYLAQHYIGLEQTYFTALDEANNFIETVKTLKGTEPSLQTVYLLSNSLIDSKLKDKLKETLPVQQLADLGAENEKMPSYVKQIIEAAAKTFSIAEYLLPKFEPDLDYKVDASIADKEGDVLEEKIGSEKKEIEDLDLVNNLVKPVVVGAAAVGINDMAKTEIKATENKATELPKPQEISPEVSTDDSEIKDKISKEKTEDSGKKIDETVIELKEKSAEDEKKKESDENEVSKPEAEVKEDSSKVEEKFEKKTEEKPEKKLVVEAEKKEEPVVEPEKEVDLAQFTNSAVDFSAFSKKSDKSSTKKNSTEKEEQKMPKKELIKNDSEAGNMTKMIFIGFMSFIITIALGVGIGLTYLKFSEQKKLEPVLEVELSPTPTPEVTPEPLPEIVNADYKLLVVNATAKAGYAGTIATDLEELDFEGVDAKNALGIYEDGNYLLVEEESSENEALLEQVELATSLEFTLTIGMEDEDGSGDYSAIVVLSE